jgi:serine/threonine protein kinase
MSTWNKALQSSPFLNKPLLPFEEWHIEFSEIVVGTRVGIGFFGEVFRGIWNGTDVAIKLFLEQDLTMENMEDFCNEISILSRFRHPNVILFLGACMKPPRLSLVTEYMEMGSLYYLIHNSGQKVKISWRRRLKMLRDICR